MNERIDSLIEQAGEYASSNYKAPVRSKEPNKLWEDGHVDWHSLFNRKLAELIIKECAFICNENAETYQYSYTPAKAALAKSTSEHCSYLIKQHFGVKE